MTGQSDSSSKPTWQPPAKLEDLFAGTSGNSFSKINAPTAGARTEKPLEKGSARYQLYSVGTPNGQKVGILLEELKADYDEHVIMINGDQFTSGFVSINPNSKIPAMIDQKDPENPIKLFESGSILVHVADQEGRFIPGLDEPAARAEVMNWLMWQMGSGPYFGQFGHFYRYAPPEQVDARNYGVARYGMETQRLLSVLDMALEGKDYVSSWGYSIADMAIYPWVKCVMNDGFYKSGDFLGTEKYENVLKWLETVGEREGVQRGLKVTPFPSS